VHVILEQPLYKWFHCSHQLLHSFHVI